ncbi:MAG TPA: hypothetical protein VGQ66_04770 [Candidatus Limnocylindria bacterium]|jgi:hypothetical protein|nr:hypothetical protein [Candidatus Limnocylindria bacterium]
MDPKIRDYIQDHRERYTREAIRSQLIAAGHDPAAIDQALDKAWSEPARIRADGGGAAGQVQTGWAILLYLAGFSVPIWFLVSSMTSRSLSPAWTIGGVVFLVLYAVIGLLVVRWVARWDPPSGFLAWERAIVGLPVLFALLVGVGFFTTCLAAYRYA